MSSEDRVGRADAAPPEERAGDAGAPNANGPDGRAPTERATDEASDPPDGDADWRRLHPAWVLARTIRVLRGLVPAIIGLAVGLREWAVPAAVALALLVVGIRVLEWRATRYAVLDDGLRVRSGVLARRERVVPASRISALDTSRGLVQRLFGLVALEVQTAGGGKQAELHLDALSTDEAERLRVALGHAAAHGPPATGRGPEVVPPTGSVLPAPEPVYAITGRQLVVAALTGPQLGLVAVLVGSVLSQGHELLPDGLTARVEDELSRASAATVVVFVVLGVLLAAAVSVVGTVLAFAEFAVVRDDRRLRIRRGLLTERTGTVPLDRIHGVRIVEGLLRRPLGFATVQVEVAGYRGDDELTRTLVPLVARRDLPDLLSRLLPEIPWPEDALARPPVRARRRYRTVPLLVAAVPAVAAAIWLPGAAKLAALLPLVAATLVGDARWRGAGWTLGPETLAVRRQLVARTTLLALARRVQRVDVRDQPLQRRAGLATFDLVLATGRHGRVQHLDAADADRLQRETAARTAGTPPPAVRRAASLSFAAPPE